MEEIIIIIVSTVPVTLAWLFIRDCQLNRKRELEQERKGNLHAIKVMYQYFREKGIPTEYDYEKDIKDLENQSFEVRIIDYFSIRQYRKT